MKSEAIVKINKMGKVTYILAKITRICLIVGIVGVIVGMIAVSLLPKNSVLVNVGGTADVIVDTEAFAGRFFKLNNIGTLVDLGDVSGNPDPNATLTLGDNKYAFVSLETVGSKLVNHFAYSGIELGVKNLIIALMGALMEIIVSLVLVRHGEALCKAFRDCNNPFEENILARMKSLVIALAVWLILSSTGENMAKGAINGKVDVVFGVDLTRVLITLFCIVMILAFRYGAELQQQADETL